MNKNIGEFPGNILFLDFQQSQFIVLLAQFNEKFFFAKAAQIEEAVNRSFFSVGV